MLNVYIVFRFATFVQGKHKTKNQTKNTKQSKTLISLILFSSSGVQNFHPNGNETRTENVHKRKKPIHSRRILKKLRKYLPTQTTKYRKFQFNPFTD
jgi:hypothetical protein